MIFVFVCLIRDVLVIGKDHKIWLDERHEEKWMFIGRNANLQYKNIDDHTDQWGISSENILYYIIPLTDYYSQSIHIDEVHEQLIIQLRNLSALDSNSNSLFVFIQPSSISRNYAKFSSEIESIKIDMRRKQYKIVEYCFNIDPSNEQGRFYFYSSHEFQNWQRRQFQLQIHEDIVHHLKDNTNKFLMET